MADVDEHLGQDLAHGLRKHARLTVISGVILVVAGLCAILSPFVAGISISVLVGATLAVSGLSQAFLAFRAGAFGRGLVVFAVGILMAIAGFYMMNQPVAGLAALTIILMSYLLASGVLEIVVALQLRPAAGWGLELASGLLTMLLGILLWRQFPLSGVWAIGVLFGIKMIGSGWALIFIGRSVRHAGEEAASA